ncbi:septal ring lytic transglycosylase RlpA family protein [Flavobacterium sp.]|uniref:septal ring lytic transglycosylase RlpA family protein n=1 Tax=Flavobacterium sp. TaxID=239 RepID=UPI0038D044CC
MKKRIPKLLVLFIVLLGTSFFAQSILIGKKDTKTISKDSVKKVKLSDKDLVIADSLAANKDKFKPYKKTARASYYANKFHGRRTASGRVYDMNKLTAAHKTLPFGTKIRVTNISNGKTVVVEITDRGPFVRGREIDLSKKAFFTIASSSGAGYINVSLDILQN